MKNHLASIVIIIILLCMIMHLWKTNPDTFYSQPSIAQIPTVPIINTYLSNSLDSANSIINESRFTVLDNQDRINSIEKRIHKIKTDLASINTPNSNTTTNNFTFY